MPTCDEIIKLVEKCIQTLSKIRIHKPDAYLKKLESNVGYCSAEFDSLIIVLDFVTSFINKCPKVIEYVAKQSFSEGYIKNVQKALNDLGCE